MAKIHQDRIKELENKVSSLEINTPKNNLDDKVKDIEEKQNYLIEETNNKYCCNICSFTTYYRKGLKIHKRKMHKTYYCELCDEVFDTARDLKIHIYTHSYTRENQMEKCKNCDFESTTVYTMEVHVGKCRDTNFECGLCEFTFDSGADLDLHLKTCEIYECGKCWIRDKNLSEMKKHIRETHSDSTQISYIKMDRNIESEVSEKYYSLSEL